MSDEFAADCEATAKALRRVPADLRRALSAGVRTQVAEPLATRIGAAASGPYARVLRAGTKARAGANPTIVVGGLSPKLSGGGGPRSVVFGTEFGGGKRLTAVPRAGATRRGRGAGYRRYSTNQFRANRHPFVFRTVHANMDRILDAYADIVGKVLGNG